MGVLALEAKRTSIILILQVTLAVIRPVSIDVWLPSEVLGLVSVNALGPIVFHVLLGTVSCFILVDVEHLWVHGSLQVFQILYALAFLVCYVEWHYISQFRLGHLLALFFF